MSSTKQKQKQKTIRRTPRSKQPESDGQYILKLVLVLLLGTLWLKFGTAFHLGDLPITGIPVGALFGFVLVSHFEHVQFDRKIWYAVLVVATVVSYFLPAGIII